MLFWRWNLARIDLFSGLPLQKRTGPSNGLFLANLMLICVLKLFRLLVDSIKVSFKACAISIIQVIIRRRRNIINIEDLVDRCGSFLLVVLLILFHGLPRISESLCIKTDKLTWLFLDCWLFHIFNILRFLFIRVGIINEFTAEIRISRITIHDLTGYYGDLFGAAYYSYIIISIIKNTSSLNFNFLFIVKAFRINDNRIHTDL